MKRICAWCGRPLDDGTSEGTSVTHGLCPDCRRTHFGPSRSAAAVDLVRRILVPFDWSDSARQALQLAVSLGRPHDAEIVLAYVVPVAVLAYGPPSEDYLRHLGDELERAGAEAANETLRCVVLEGDPAASIVATACKSKFDLIVMGTHGRTGLSRMLMGSVAEAVVRKAPCPVLTLRVPAILSGADAGSCTTAARSREKELSP